jgi:glutamine amidotransferase
MRVVILDYGVGNLFSLTAAVEREGARPLVVSELPSCGFDAVILPGVGNFAPAAARLRALGEALAHLVERNVPLLGICLGMQVLFDASEEAPGEGLHLLPGQVVRLPSSVKVPHIGWNTLEIVRPSPLVEGLARGEWVYFVHSFYPRPLDEGVILATCDYGTRFAAIVGRGRLFGTQFHPEKSGPTGRKILRNFLRLARQ